MTYDTVSRIAQQGGSLYFMLLFLAAAAYAFWPRNRETFRRAASAALSQDDADDRPL
jgi:cytochrome c oxidase cbb3-type subunit 4